MTDQIKTIKVSATWIEVVQYEPQIPRRASSAPLTPARRRPHPPLALRSPLCVACGKPADQWVIYAHRTEACCGGCRPLLVTPLTEAV